MPGGKSVLPNINLRDCVLEDNTTGEVCRVVWTANALLEILNLSSNKITSKGVKSFAKLIKEYGSTLSVLHCKDNKITLKGVSYVVRALWEAIKVIQLDSNESR